MPAIVGQGRPWPVPNCYPVTTRARKAMNSFEIRRRATRFGTEGSVVQIHSPRPLTSLANPRFSVWLAARFRSKGTSEPSDLEPEFEQARLNSDKTLEIARNPGAAIAPKSTTLDTTRVIRSEDGARPFAC
jgi:hypothetical protein